MILICPLLRLVMKGQRHLHLMQKISPDIPRRKPVLITVLSQYGQLLQDTQSQNYTQNRSSHGPEVRITSFREYPPLVSTAIHHLMAGKCQYVAKEAPHQLAMGGWEHVTLLDSGSFLCGQTSYVNCVHNVFLFLFLFYCYTLATHTF